MKSKEVAWKAKTDVVVWWIQILSSMCIMFICSLLYMYVLLTEVSTMQFQQIATCRIPSKTLCHVQHTYLGPLDPHWQSPGGHFGGCSHSMDGASLCTTSGGTGVLYFKTACNVSFHSDLLEFWTSTSPTGEWPPSLLLHGPLSCKELWALYTVHTWCSILFGVWWITDHARNDVRDLEIIFSTCRLTLQVQGIAWS